VLNEHRVYSDRFEVAGTIDCLGLLDGQAVLLDFATGRPQDVCKDLQTAGYLALALEWQEEDVPLAAFLSAHKVVRRYAVQLRASGTFVVSYADPRDHAFRTLVRAQRMSRRPLREVRECAGLDVMRPEAANGVGGSSPPARCSSPSVWTAARSPASATSNRPSSTARRSAPRPNASRSSLPR
jgi:hypothetical protein